jgi:ATP-dependent Lhr-like helicase
LREVVLQLAGCELPAGVWEEKILAPRVPDYDPQELDTLFLSGELVWGRLCPPRRDDGDGPALAAMTRTIPIAVVARDDLVWLLPEERSSGEAFCSSNAAEILHVLRQRGALFFAELKSLSGLLGGHVEDALRQLAALGLVSSDTFAAVRSLAGGMKARSRPTRGRPQRVHRAGSPVGRWSLFPGVTQPCERDERAAKWAQLLLRRYGVVFRDLLAREGAAPSCGGWNSAAKCAADGSSAASAASSSRSNRWWNNSAACATRRGRSTIGFSSPRPIR